MTHITDHNTLSYYAGMIDHRGEFKLTCENKAQLLIKSKSRTQILAVQSAFGGEIKNVRNHYAIRYNNTICRAIINQIGPYLLYRTPIKKICAGKSWELPPHQPPHFDHYLGGAIDAMRAFHSYEAGGRIYPTFTFCYQNETEREWLDAKPAVNNSIKWTWDKAKTALERFKPFIREYDTYRIALYDQLNEPFDESILTSKDHAYYLTLAESRRQAAIDKAAAKIEARKQLGLDRIKREREVKRQRAIDRFIQGFGHNSALQYAWKLEHGQTTRSAETYEDLYWFQFRTHKICRICEANLPLDHFQPQIKLYGGYVHQCKRCEYDRYVKPHLAMRKERTKTWQRANPIKAKASHRKQQAKTPNRMKRNLMNRIRQLVGSKSERSHDLIGCSPHELTLYLSSLFQPGMSLNNYGEWHIDHKIPCRAFDLTTKEGRMACFHHTNLQPLWAADNTFKSDRLPDGQSARWVSGPN